MTTNKLPDVVWLSPSVMRSDGWHMSYIAHALGNSHCYVQKSALDAMTAERDALKQEAELWEETYRDTRRILDEDTQPALDSAREALARATELLRGMKHVAECEGWHMAHADEVEDMRDFLAAQPETKT